MNASGASALLAYALLLSIIPAAAQDPEATASPGRVFKVDDTGTVVLDPVLEMQWEPPSRTGASALVSASTRVSVQLNLGPWVGRSGRIYMTLPRTNGPTVRATWQTGGTLLPGTLVSGDRAIVYAGPVTSPMMRDLIDIAINADGARLDQPEALAFGFEIELDQ